MLWELARNPEVQDTLFEEICKVMPSPTSQVVYDDLANLPFLKAIIKETLRVHTAILGPFPRVTVEDMVIEGQPVPKGVCKVTIRSLLYHCLHCYWLMVK